MQESPEHAPARSYWPLLLAAGISMLIIGIISSLIVSAIGLILVLVSLGGWTMENREQAHPLGEPDLGEQDEGELIRE